MSAMNNHVTKPYYKGISAEKQYCKLMIPVSAYSKERIVADYGVILLPSDLKVLNALAAFTHNFSITFPSQKRLAELTKLTDRTVRRSLDRLREAGFVSTYQRWNNSLLYKMADIFQDCDVRRALANVCPTFKFLAIFFLFSPNPTVQSDDVRLRNNLFINLPSVTQSHDYITGKETKPYDYIKNTSKLKTTKSQSVRRPMAEYGGISQVIRELKFLNLTKFGQIKLSAFPDGAILYATDQYKKSRNKPKDRFAWFFTVCGRWCQINNIEPNWKYLEELKERHHMPDGARMTFETPDEQPFAEKGSGAVFKKETGSKPKEEYIPQPTVIPQRPEPTREQLLKDARTYLFAPKGVGATEELRQALLIDLSNKYPGIIFEAQQLGPLGPQSSEEVQARSDARKAALGMKPIDYGPPRQFETPRRYEPPLPREQVEPQPISEIISYEVALQLSQGKIPNELPKPKSSSKLTQVKSYSRVEEEHGDEEY